MAWRKKQISAWLVQKPAAVYLNFLSWEPVLNKLKLLGSNPVYSYCYYAASSCTSDFDRVVHSALVLGLDYGRQSKLQRLIFLRTALVQRAEIIMLKRWSCASLCRFLFFFTFIYLNSLDSANCLPNLSKTHFSTISYRQLSIKFPVVCIYLFIINWQVSSLARLGCRRNF